MQAGISTATLFPQEHTEKAIETIKALGAQTTEIFLSTFYEYRPEFAKELARKTAEINVNSVHVMPLNFEANLFNSTRRVQGDGFYWLDQVARSAQLLNCKNYTFHGFLRGNGEGEDVDVVAWRFRQAVNFCKNYGLNICLENTACYAFNRPDFFPAVKERVPDLLAVFDIKQARRSGYPYPMYIKAMAGSIAYAHLSDVDENGNVRLPGFGKYDFEDVLKRLKDVGFDGDLLIEVYRDCFGGAEELKNSLEFLNELCYKLG